MLTIGYLERVAFPDWGVRAMTAKADTGARTGAIDVAEYDERDDGTVHFALRMGRGEDARLKHVTAPITRRSRVRSASGHAADRLFVETTLRLGDHTKTIELSLVCRRKMRVRVLLGRRALADDFLVDSARKFLIPQPARPAGRKKRP